jgi:hypothetical protein
MKATCEHDEAEMSVLLTRSLEKHRAMDFYKIQLQV